MKELRETCPKLIVIALSGRLEAGLVRPKERRNLIWLKAHYTGRDHVRRQGVGAGDDDVHRHKLPLAGTVAFHGHGDVDHHQTQIVGAYHIHADGCNT